MLLVSLVFSAVTAAMFVGFLAVTGRLSPSAHLIRKRMAEELGAGRKPDYQQELFKNLDKVQLPELGAPGLPDVDKPQPAPRRPSIRQALEILVDQARVPLTVRQLLVIVSGLGVGFGLLATVMGGLFAGIPVCLAGTAAPFLFLHLKRKARQESFLKQLPNAFELMARVVRAGQSVQQALVSVTESFDDPIKSEFASCQQQQNLGLRPEVTYRDMAERSGILELRIFVMAMLLHRQTGGNLSEALDRLAGLVRARLQQRENIRALTAEGRLQGITLFVLPFLIFGVLMVINRRYAQVLLDHVPLLAATLASMLAGLLWIRRIVRIEV